MWLEQKTNKKIKKTVLISLKKEKPLTELMITISLYIYN